MLTKRLVSTAVMSALGVSVFPQFACAEFITLSWSGMFTMLDETGTALANTAIPAKGNNQYHTPISGTMTYDTVTGSGFGTQVPFYFLPRTSPGEITGITFRSVGDGAGGPGNLMLGNMLWNWGGTTGIPVSVVLDATGLFDTMASGALHAGQIISGTGALPASDGTYVGANVPGTVTGPGGYAGYLGLGPNPIVTTAYDLTSECTRAGVSSDGACMGLSPSGNLPVIYDTAPNPNDFTANTGGTIGGNPMIDGPFAGSNANFDITSLTVTGITPVPLPAAIWLFGSGLLGMASAARRRKPRNTGLRLSD